MTTKKYEGWIIEELQSLLDDYIFHRDRVAETYSERSDLNVEIHSIKQELIKRGKGE